jgi:hypothetical protein
MLGNLLPVARTGDGEDVVLERRSLRLPARTLTGRPSKVPVATEIAGLRLGSAAFVFVPGELFVEIGLSIRASSSSAPTWVVGYAEDYVGYIPTERAFEEGGYELGPGPWARVGRGSGSTIQREVSALLRHLR